MLTLPSAEPPRPRTGAFKSPRSCTDCTTATGEDSPDDVGLARRKELVRRGESGPSLRARMRAPDLVLARRRRRRAVARAFCSSTSMWCTAAAQINESAHSTSVRTTFIGCCGPTTLRLPWRNKLSTTDTWESW